MQLKLRRSQRETGVLSKSAVFCLDARAQFTADESNSINRYKLSGQVIYNSEASKRALARSETANDGSILGGIKGLAHAAVAGMNLNISIYSLSQGQHIECKSLDELLGAEEAVVTACKNLKGYLDAAATFDGREVLVDFSDDGPAIVAQATAPPLQIVQQPVQTISAPTSAPVSEPGPPAPVNVVSIGTTLKELTVDPMFRMIAIPAVLMVIVFIAFVSFHR